ncbi:MAG: PD40 domain-containing protein [Acidobacteria bacterium]|nr:PD40 domain-containing protein [Acidobacteriota bacterium]
MRTSHFLCLLLCLFSTAAFSQKSIEFPNLNGPYLGQPPPGEKAVCFASGLITYEVHESPILFQEGQEILIGSMMEGLKYYRWMNGIWSLENTLPFDPPANCNGVSLSPSGNRVYFLIWTGDDEDFYFIEKRGDGWSALHSLGDPVNDFPTHWQFSIAMNENLYFSTGGKVVVSVFDGHHHQKPVPLKQVNNEDLEGGTPFIAPDESYLMVSIEKDLHISYRLSDNKWTEPVNLGPSINMNDCYDLCPRISPDGKYLFFISRRSGPDFRIYWSEAGFIERLKPEHVKEKD